MQQVSNVGRGFIPLSNIRLTRAVAVLRRTRVRGGKQRRGDFSQECLDFIRACNELHGGPPRIVQPHEVEFFRHLLGRKALNRLKRFHTGYKHLLDSVPEVVRNAISEAAAGNASAASYHLGNLYGTAFASHFSDTKLYAALNALDGIAAESCAQAVYPPTALVLPGRHRKNFIAAIKLLALDGLQTQVALQALDEVQFGHPYK